MSFVPKPSQRPAIQDIDFSDRLKRIRRAYQNLDPNGQVDWKPDRTSDIFELRTIRYKARYPNDVKRFIKKIHRIAIPQPSMFELDGETGELDRQHKVREALVYTLSEIVDNPNIEEGPVGYNTNVGWYKVPTIRYQNHDEFGNGTDPIETGSKNIFYLEFKPELVDKIISEADNDVIQLGVSVANLVGDRWSEDLSVHNLEEFKNADDIYMLMEASKNGYLTKEEGGYREFMDARVEARKQLKPIKKKKNIRGEIVAE